MTNSAQSTASMPLLAGALLCAFTAASLAAHPYLDDRLVLLNEQIAAHPENGRLFLSRGSLLLDERQAREALADFDRALELDPALSIAHLLRAQAFLADGEGERALEAARRFLELEPESAKGWRTLARVHGASAAPGGATEPSLALDDAIAAFDRYFELATEPRPDDYLERADLQRRAGRFDEAVNGLDAGAARLGPLTALLRSALEIERGRGRLEAALGFADRLAAASPQEERWQVERARILAKLGREEEAVAALLQAEAALANRSSARRSAPALTGLALEIDRLQAELATPAGAAGRRP